MAPAKTTAKAPEKANPPLEMLTMREASRRLGACSETLRHKIADAGLIPDAIIHAGHNRRPAPLFVAPRLPELARLLNPTRHSEPETIS